MGCNGIRVEDPDRPPAALAAGLAERTRPTVLDIVVTVIRSHASAVDNRTAEIRQGSWVAYACHRNDRRPKEPSTNPD